MAVVAVLGGCEWVFPFEPDDGIPVDGAPPRFGTPMKVQAVDVGPSEYLGDPALDAGETQIAFVRQDADTAGSADIFLAASTGNPLAWAASFQVDMSIAMQDEYNPKLSADGNTMWLAVPTGTPVVRAFSRTFAAPNKWMDVTGDEAAGLENALDTRPDCITPDGLHFVVHRNNGEIPFLVELERAVPGQAWTEVPGTMAVINAAGPAANGYLTPDALEIVFTLQAAGQTDYDLYYARRAALRDPFDTPVELTELSSPMQETDPWLSPDGRRIYFGRAHGGTPRSEWGIYYAER